MCSVIAKLNMSEKELLSEWEASQISSAWHYLGGAGVNIGRYGVSLNRLIQEGNEQRASERDLRYGSRL